MDWERDRGAHCEYLKDVLDAAIHARASSGEPFGLRVAAAARSRSGILRRYCTPARRSRRAPHTHQACPRPSVEPVPALRRAGLPAASLVAQTLSFGSIIRSAVDWLTLPLRSSSPSFERVIMMNSV